MKQNILTLTLKALSAFIMALTVNQSVDVLAQSNFRWSTPQQIPGYVDNSAFPPILITDQNRTIHAFTSQWLGGDEDEPIRAIMYNQWTQAEGWTIPVDIMLSPRKNDARVQDAFLDNQGIMHLIFFGGDGTDANIYYTQAPAVRAGRAQAWSKPLLVGDAANSPDAAVLGGDDKGNLAIIYSGKSAGWGLYTIYSNDGGKTWTKPEPTFLTYGEYFPFTVKLSPGQSGVIHLVWDVRDTGGNGRQINYAQLDLEAKQWSEQTTLADVETGYGVLNPTVIEHDGELVVAYSGVTLQRSADGGQTWSKSINPFRHTGVNGIMSFVEDSKSDLHLFWAQRITGSPDIHGVWHSVWQNGRWSEPEAVISGPQNPDQTGNKAFDPFDVRANISQGNVVLVTWRQDPGLKANGVWNSQTLLDSPELPLIPLPEPAFIHGNTEFTPTAAPVSAHENADSLVNVNLPSDVVTPVNPMVHIAVGLIPVVALIVMLVGKMVISSQRNL